ncbi:HAMP domain-containing histidine kinase [Brevundimonas sp. AJA228-03]|uniref:sensor histidine kinase n=1 Tax=Brevundimonas sp. AJA228-03 TaxID=2752515 RepID=UPI001AE0DCF2|nr:HAMP domain-containing sensor histidine kinase [Brevundimonas sp. AJA228-03]QTN20144.1 HAMP domain-containing histidine kinase [Brevundimonas sp. AJA228-03]
MSRPSSLSTLPGVWRRWLAERTSTQLVATLAIMAALALTGSLLITGQAARLDQRQQAALAALADFAAIAVKLPPDAGAEEMTESDAAYWSAFLSAFQDGPSRESITLEETCRTGRGGAGVRFIRAPVGKPAGLAALETARTYRLSRLGPGVYRVRLAPGQLCPARAIEAVIVKRPVGALQVIVGRVVDPAGVAWRWAVLSVALTGALILVSGLAAATFARRRLTSAIAEVSLALDRAAVGDFSRRAPDVAVAPEMTALSTQVNRTLDRLEELLSWLRDSADQLAHDFRTPLARASLRLDRLMEADDPAERARLGEEAKQDLADITRAMNEAMALRDGEAWLFEDVRLDVLAEACVELYQPIADMRGIRIVAGGEPVSVLGVRSLLQRAVANLVDNAVKFSPDGGTVTLRAYADDAEVAISIADQGPGMSGPVPARVEGTASHGMGLAFVRAILRRHGGRMTIDDAVPGAIVTAHFPR